MGITRPGTGPQLRLVSPPPQAVGPAQVASPIASPGPPSLAPSTILPLLTHIAPNRGHGLARWFGRLVQPGVVLQTAEWVTLGIDVSPLLLSSQVYVRAATTTLLAQVIPEITDRSSIDLISRILFGIEDTHPEVRSAVVAAMTRLMPTLPDEDQRMAAVLIESRMLHAPTSTAQQGWTRLYDILLAAVEGETLRDRAQFLERLLCMEAAQDTHPLRARVPALLEQLAQRLTPNPALRETLRGQLNNVDLQQQDVDRSALKELHRRYAYTWAGAVSPGALRLLILTGDRIMDRDDAMLYIENESAPVAGAVRPINGFGDQLEHLATSVQNREHAAEGLRGPRLGIVGHAARLAQTLPAFGDATVAAMTIDEYLARADPTTLLDSAILNVHMRLSPGGMSPAAVLLLLQGVAPFGISMGDVELTPDHALHLTLPIPMAPPRMASGETITMSVRQARVIKHHAAVLRPRVTFVDPVAQALYVAIFPDHDGPEIVWYPRQADWEAIIPQMSVVGAGAPTRYTLPTYREPHFVQRFLITWLRQSAYKGIVQILETAWMLQHRIDEGSSPPGLHAVGDTQVPSLHAQPSLEAQLTTLMASNDLQIDLHDWPAMQRVWPAVVGRLQGNQLLRAGLRQIATGRTPT